MKQTDRKHWKLTFISVRNWTNFGVLSEINPVKGGHGMPQNESQALYWPGTTEKDGIGIFWNYGSCFKIFVLCGTIPMIGVPIPNTFPVICIGQEKTEPGK
jgi:hypothetical protein